MYKAKINIGDYKEGDIVPDEKAIIWKEMYVNSPVEEVIDNTKEVIAKEPEAEKISNLPTLKDAEVLGPEEEPKKEDSSDSMLDDYLDRNESVVKKSISKDDIPKDKLEKLIKIEEKGKKRKKVIFALKKKLERY